VLQPTLLQEPVADLGFLNRGKCQRHEDRDAAGAEGYGGGGVVPLPDFLKFLVPMENSDAMWLTFQPCNLHIQHTQSMNFNDTRVYRSLTGPEN